MAKATTPMMEQYFRIKENYRDCILLYRMGDFYEMFGEDAIVGSKVLEITLTSRERGKKERIPLCGVPWHALDSYLPTLVSKGYKVAICEQLEDPRTAKGLVDRDVVRIVTPGTVLEGTVLDSRANNYLMAIAVSGESCGLSFVDISTGEFVVTQVDGDDVRGRVLAEFAQRSPKEVLHPRDFSDKSLLEEFALSGASLTELDDVSWIREASESALKRHFKLQSVEGLGLADRPLAISSAGAVLRYVETTQKRDLGFLSPPRFFSTSDKLVLDQTTLRNLEVLRNVRDGGSDGTLISVLDRTQTSMGSRLLKRWLTQPLMDVVSVNQRLDAVQELVSNTVSRHELSSCLGGVRDLERLVGKVVYGSANARDLVAVRDCLERVPDIKSNLSGLKSKILDDVRASMKDVTELSSLIRRAIVDDPPISSKEGGLIKDGYDSEIDGLRRATKGDQEWIAGLEETEKKRTGIKNLKVGFNNIFGYYIEVSKSNLKQIPSDYERKQTLTTGERFITPELKERERSILSANERLNTFEHEAFLRVRDQTAAHAQDLREVSNAIATVDVLCSFAEVAVASKYCRPEVNESDTIILKDSRHPVVEKTLRTATPTLVSSDPLLIASPFPQQRLGWTPGHAATWITV